ncbi:MAG: MotA/TolQ/ExbB proton channel family protein [Myxococcales bacterium]|nr:MotA/TolQ/ExbB proton channel family protein [Myxococcales bacterium]MDD9971474.1 MotA/TolQ/ExbB proton channel family protein [Myxococcales bacterium]
MDIQERLTAFALLGATWVMWLLVALSIVSVAIILERLYFFLSTRDDIDTLRNNLTQFLRRGDREGARKALAASRSMEAQVAVAGLEAADDGSESANERMQGEQHVARLVMERNLVFLGTVGNNAPFVGLLGTVIGIIRAFHSLDESQGKVTAGLMADIGEALVATAIGIVVALPAVAAFNYFQRLIKARLARGSALGSDVLSHLMSTRSQPDAAE